MGSSFWSGATPRDWQVPSWSPFSFGPHPIIIIVIIIVRGPLAPRPRPRPRLLLSPSKPKSPLSLPGQSLALALGCGSLAPWLAPCLRGSSDCHFLPQLLLSFPSGTEGPVHHLAALLHSLSTQTQTQTLTLDCPSLSSSLLLLLAGPFTRSHTLFLITTPSIVPSSIFLFSLPISLNLNLTLTLPLSPLSSPPSRLSSILPYTEYSRSAFCWCSQSCYSRHARSTIQPSLPPPSGNFGPESTRPLDHPN